MTQKHTNNWMQVKPNDFGRKYDNQENIIKKQNHKQYNKRIRRAQRRPESGNTHRFTQKKKKKEDIKLENARPWWNIWILVQEIRLHSRQTSTRNEHMPTRSTCTRTDDSRKDHIDPEGPTQGDNPKELQTHNLLTDDEENINSTNKGRDLLLVNKPQNVPWGTDRMLQKIQRHRRATLRKSAHTKREQDQREKI